MMTDGYSGAIFHVCVHFTYFLKITNSHTNMVFAVAPWISREFYFIAYFVFRNQCCRFLSGVKRCSNNPTGLEGPRCPADWVRDGFYSGHFSNPLQSPSPYLFFPCPSAHQPPSFHSLVSNAINTTCLKGGVGCSTRTNEMCGIPVIYVKETRKGGISTTNNTGASIKFFFFPFYFLLVFFTSTSTST
jgi:hypothetical protein